MKKTNLAVRIWDVLYPLLMYYTIIVVVMFVTQGIFGTESKYYMFRQIIATLVALPIVYTMFYRADVLMGISSAQMKLQSRSYHMKNAIFIVVIAACCGISLNNLISMSPLISMSEAFAKANEDFYAGPFWSELIGSVLLTPMLEELIYRGVIYSRIKRQIGVKLAIVLSAFIFGMMHFNVVQFVYAFVLGMVLAFFMEKSGHVYGAMLGHIVVNLISVVRTETLWLEWTVDGSTLAWGVSFVLFIIGLLLLHRYWSEPIGK